MNQPQKEQILQAIEEFEAGKPIPVQMRESVNAYLRISAGINRMKQKHVSVGRKHEQRTIYAEFMKVMTPSSALASIVGAKPLPRTEVVRKLWLYIKRENLQDKVNKRLINADAKLHAVFQKPQVTMFEMAGLIGKHLG